MKTLRLRKSMISGLLLSCILLLCGCVKTSQAENANSTARTNQNVSENADTQENIANGDYRIVVLDPGHGGAFPGASYQGFLEKDLTLKVARYIKEYLETNYAGVSVYLTRNDDAGLSDNTKEDLEKRVEMASALGAELLVSLHFNTEPNYHNAAGALVCISKQPNVNSASQNLANSILAQLEQLGIRNRGPFLRDSDQYFDENGAAMDYYAICRYSAAAGFPGAIVEHCFMDNPEELRFFGSEEALRKLAAADAAGIAVYMGLTAI